MHGASTVSNQAAAQYAHTVKDMPHDGDADDQKASAQAAAKADQAQKANAASGKPKGVGDNVDITA